MSLKQSEPLMPDDNTHHAEQNHWSGCGRATSVAVTDALDRLHRSVFSFSKSIQFLPTMKFDKIKLPSIRKEQLLKELKQSAKTFYYGHFLGPGDASRLKFTPSGDGIQIDGPRETIERLVSNLKLLGAKAGSKKP